MQVLWMGAAVLLCQLQGPVAAPALAAPPPAVGPAQPGLLSSGQQATRSVPVVPAEKTMESGSTNKGTGRNGWQAPGFNVPATSGTLGTASAAGQGPIGSGATVAGSSAPSQVTAPLVIPPPTASGTTLAPATIAPHESPSRQAAAASTVAPPTTSSAATGPSGKYHISPPEMMADALMPRQGAGLAGRALTLTTALAVSLDPRQRLEIARTYWRLVEAVANYHYASDHLRQVEALPAKDPVPALLKTARVSATAAVREAELNALTVQHELAALCLFPAGVPLPLPADRPHVGPYRTAFAELFATASAPSRARLIDQVLPYLRRAIDVRASGAETAEEAFQTASAAERAGQGDLSTTLLCLSEWTRQRRSFVQVVCQYNDRIAEYAILAYPTASPQSLVAMLIDPVREPVRPLNFQDESAAATSAGAGLGTAPGGLTLPLPGARRPTRAIPPQGTMSSPPAASPGARPAAAGSGTPVAADGRPSSPVVVPPGSAAAPGTSSPPRTLVPVVPTAPPAGEGEPAGKRAVERPILPNGSSASGYGLLGGLTGLTPQSQASELAAALHWNRAMPEGIGDPLALSEALEARSPLERRAVITSYWEVAGRAAEYQVLGQQADALRMLSGGLEGEQERRCEGLRLRGMQQATEAAMLEGRVAVVDAEYDLALRTGREQQARWPLAASAPWAGAFAVQPAVSGPRAVEKMSGLLASQYAALTSRAAAVVAADQARAEAADRYEKERVGLARALASLGQQTDETLSFLQLLGQYNDNIGQYVLTVAPVGASGAQLAAAMIPSGAVAPTRAGVPAGR